MREKEKEASYLRLQARYRLGSFTMLDLWSRGSFLRNAVLAGLVWKRRAKRFPSRSHLAEIKHMFNAIETKRERKNKRTGHYSLQHVSSIYYDLRVRHLNASQHETASIHVSLEVIRKVQQNKTRRNSQTWTLIGVEAWSVWMEIFSVSNVFFLLLHIYL